MNGEWRVTVDFSTRRKTKIKIAVKKRLLRSDSTYNFNKNFWVFYIVKNWIKRTKLSEAHLSFLVAVRVFRDSLYPSSLLWACCFRESNVKIPPSVLFHHKIRFLSYTSSFSGDETVARRVFRLKPSKIHREKNLYTLTQQVGRRNNRRWRKDPVRNVIDSKYLKES